MVAIGDCSVHTHTENCCTSALHIVHLWNIFNNFEVKLLSFNLENGAGKINTERYSVSKWEKNGKL